jgi:hypothetical protein
MSHTDRCLRPVVAAILTVCLATTWYGSPVWAGEGKKADRPPRHEKTAKAERTPAAEKQPAFPTVRKAEKATRPSEATETRGAYAVGRRAIEAALAQPTSLDVTEESFSNVIDHLKKVHKIEIQFDAVTLEEVGFSFDKQITVDLKGISLRSALDLLTHLEGFVFTIHDEILLITTPDQRDNAYLTFEVYDVADLVACRDEKGRPWDDYGTLIELITSHIEPGSWDAVGGPASISPAPLGSAKALVVRHHSEAHYQIEQLFARIRAIGAKSKGDAKPPTRQRPQQEEDEEYGRRPSGF